MTTRDAEFAALLRWYPRSWRDAHSAVVLGTLLDEAEAIGRRHPTRAQRRSAAWDGLGHHLDRRLAIITAAAGAAFAIVAIVAMHAFPPLLSGPSSGEVTLAAVSGLVRVAATAASVALTITSLVATTRTRGLPAGTALWAAAAGVLTGVSLGAVQLSWAVGFDAADAGIPPSPLGQALPSLLLTCVLLGGVTVMLATAPFLRGRLGGAAWPVALVAGAVVWAGMAYLAMNPPVVALCALGALVIAADRAPLGRTGAITRVAPAAPTASALLTGGRRTVATMSTVAAVAGIAAVVLCFAGPRWTGLDATRAMQVGIGVGFLAACPLALAAGVASARTGRTGWRGRTHAWAPSALWCVGLVVAASGNLFASVSDSNTVFVVLRIAAVPVALGTAWWTATLSQGTPTMRRVGALAAAAAVMLLAETLQLLPFVAPLVAGIIAVRTARAPRAVRFGVTRAR